MSKNHRITNAATTAALCVGALFFNANSADMRDISTMELVRDMGLGINLGNTMEAVIVCEPGDDGCVNWVNGMATLETSWGSPEITGAMVKGYADAGLKTLRIPVAWSNKMTADNAGGSYTISAALTDRVEQIVNYALNNGMYAIVNIHWDGGWWEKFPADSAECMRKYTNIWTQISERFKNYGDYLMFESLNEEGVWQSVWNQYDDTGNKARAFGLLNAINQKFVDIVRASGGNNGERHLLIAGYATNIDRTCDPAFKMPDDPKNRRAVSVHYYDPFGFTHLEKNESWAALRLTWGTAEDYDELNGYMDKMKTNFADKGIPVIVGEYGFASNLARDPGEIRKYTLAVAEAVYSRNMCPVLWDVQRDNRIDYYDRNARSFSDPLLVDGFKNIAGDNIPTAVNNKNLRSKTKLKRPQVTVRGKTLTVSSPANSTINFRIIDVKGKVRASFKAAGNESFSIGEIPSGRYLVEANGAAISAFNIVKGYR